MKIHRSYIIQKAWPIILANVSTPLLGLVDTAVVGRTGSLRDLGAIALGTLIFNFLYWGFAFLRMGTTSFVARAYGAGDELELRTSILRSLLTGFFIGNILILLQYPLIHLSLGILGASTEVERIASGYFYIRIWAAPATLSLYAITGTLIGLGRSDLLLRVQIMLNVLNGIFDLMFVGYFRIGASGVALGTLIAVWISLFFSLYIIATLLRSERNKGIPMFSLRHLIDKEKFKETMGANLDIMIRTLFLIAGSGWFIDQSARYGNQVLAANHILLQIISFSAYILDGFAFTVESLAGRAGGAKNRFDFHRAVLYTGEFAAFFASLLSLGIYLRGRYILTLLTDIPEVITTALPFLSWVSLYVLFSFPAFQLDGIFIGTVKTKDMRNASVLSFTGFLITTWLFQDYMTLGIRGLWMAFLAYVLYRAIALGIRYPTIRKEIFG